MCVCVLQVVHHNIELVQHFGGAVVDSMHSDGSSQTGGMVPAMAGAGAGRAASPAAGGAGVLHHQGGNTHSSVDHSAAGLKQRAAAARPQADVQMTQLRGDADD
jgi:hypothetical protein